MHPILDEPFIVLLDDEPGDDADPHATVVDSFSTWRVRRAWSPAAALAASALSLGVLALLALRPSLAAAAPPTVVPGSGHDPARPAAPRGVLCQAPIAGQPAPSRAPRPDRRELDAGRRELMTRLGALEGERWRLEDALERERAGHARATLLRSLRGVLAEHERLLALLAGLSAASGR